MSVDKLLSLASSPLGLQIDSPNDPGSHGPRRRELGEMLVRKNGFYCFEGALHVFPSGTSTYPSERSLEAWNAEDLWRNEYEGLTAGLIFFAEDTFGVQFTISGDDIVTFDPESGQISRLAGTLEEWAGQLLEEYNQLTGFPVAHAWQLAHGPIPSGKRLLPKVPFILGGEYAEANLFAVDAVEGMRYRGDLWRQIRDLPDGAQVRLKALPTH